MKSDYEAQQINTMLKHLTLAFRHCRMYNNLKELHYNKENETVEVIYWMNMKQETAKFVINVACDSNSTLIHDVEQRVYKFFS